MSRNFRCHGVTYIRTGQCNRCGVCEKETCPHFSWQANLGFCDIHSNRTGTCVTCTGNAEAYFHKAGQDTNHQICIDFPNHPFLGVIKSGICGYAFEPATEEDKIKHEKLVIAWQ